MANRNGARLSFSKKIALAAVGMAAVPIPIVVGIMTAPAIWAQSAPNAKPMFEVASIKPCKDVLSPGGRGAGINFSPGSMNLNCQTVEGYIRAAYVMYSDGTASNFLSGLSVPIEKGPAWINSERYNINAKTAGKATPEMMQGPMLQALLEDRFKLKIHREARETPVFALTVATSGLKLPQFEEGSCTPRPPIDLTKPPAPPPALGPGKKYCAKTGTLKGPNMVVDAEGITLDEFAKTFLLRSGRPVINKTGIAGRFIFHLEYAPDDDLRGLLPNDPGEPTAPSIFTAVRQQLGLKLEASRAPGEFLVIDHIERPSRN